MGNRSSGFLFAMIYTILNLEFVLPLQIQIIGICETQFMTMCQSVFKKSLETSTGNLDLINKNTVNITWKTIECGSDFVSNLNKMEALNESLSEIWSIGIVIGNAPVVNAALTYANSSAMPVFVYDTSKQKTPVSVM